MVFEVREEAPLFIGVIVALSAGALVVASAHAFVMFGSGKYTYYLLAHVFFFYVFGVYLRWHAGVEGLT